MKVLLAAVTLFASTAFAQTNLEKICSSVIQVQGDRIQTSAPSFSDGFASYMVNGAYVIADTNGNIVSHSPEKIVTIEKMGESLWILTPSRLVEMSLTGEVKGEFATNARRTNYGMTVNGSALMIAKGSSGLSSFDTKTKSIQWENRLGGVENGWPVAVTSEGSVGYAAVQSADEGGFTGILSFDTASGKVLKKSPYHYQYGVIGIDVIAQMYKGNVVLNNQGWIHLVTKAQVNSGKMIKPKWVAHQLPRDGEVNAHYMMLEGDFLIEGNELKGCGKYNTMENGDITMKGKLFTVKMP